MILPRSFFLWAAPLLDRSLQSRSCGPVGSKFNSQTFNIMPLGASIVYGADSSDGNGFRKVLWEKLAAQGANVNMIGSFTAGTMPGNYVEAQPGFRIDQVSALADHSIPKQPNLVIIHAGTNDVIQNYQVSTADQRLGALVDKLLAAIPGTTVLVSTLIPNLNPTIQSGIQTLNSKIRGMVTDRAKDGKHVYLVDMDAITKNDVNTVDGTHPTDAGYAKMGAIWFAAIQQVYAQCWFDKSPPSAAATTEAPASTSTTPKALAQSVAPSTFNPPVPTPEAVQTPSSTPSASPSTTSVELATSTSSSTSVASTPTPFSVEAPTSYSQVVPEPSTSSSSTVATSQAAPTPSTSSSTLPMSTLDDVPTSTSWPVAQPSTSTFSSSQAAPIPSTTSPSPSSTLEGPSLTSTTGTTTSSSSSGTTSTVPTVLAQSGSTMRISTMSTASSASTRSQTSTSIAPASTSSKAAAARYILDSNAGFVALAAAAAILV